MIDPGPDLILTAPKGGADIVVFGAIHGDIEGSHIAEYILTHRPHTVVVETAMNQAHGSETGNIATPEDFLMISPGSNGAAGMVDSRSRAIAHIGMQLAGLPDPLSSSLWLEVSQSGMFFSEHLVYAAAFAVGAKLVHGDRPKYLTYQRMLWEPSIVDLDDSFGITSALNYHDLVAHMRPTNAAPEETGLAEKIFIGERDAVLLQSLYNASLEAGEGAYVVGVVGASHLSGMHQLWPEGTWREIIAAGAMELPEKRGDNETPEQFGVRRALFDGVIRLTCRDDVTIDIAETLGEPPFASMEAYELTHELYGNSRMLLATLNRDQLEEVCQGWRCDMWDVLAPLRVVRPVNGGPGYDPELVLELRTFNFEINPPN